MEWDFGVTGEMKEVEPLYLELTGSPSFFRLSKTPNVLTTDLKPYIQFNNTKELKLLLPEAGNVNIHLVDKKGKTTQSLLVNKQLSAGVHIIPIADKLAGVYMIEMDVDGIKSIQKTVLNEK